MPLQDHHQIVSVDDHLIEHPQVWQSRLPERLKARGPRIEEQNGKHVWHYDGTIFPTVGLNAVAGKPAEQWGMDPVRYEDMIPGCYDPAARVKDMDLDGVQAALCFPSFPGFGGGVFQRAADKDLALICAQAWNDFYIDEWCATAPDRFVPLSIVPTWDPELAAKEILRTAAKGSRTISFPDAPVALDLPSFHSDHWEPVWNACEETGTVLSLHFGSGSFVPGFSFAKSKAMPGEMVMPDAPFAVAITLFSTNLMWTLTDLLFSGVLQRHPKLQFSLAEGGIGWIPYILERADFVWERHRHYQHDIDFHSRPSDLYREHFWGCFIDDEFGVKNRYDVGVDRIMLEIDFPHSDSNWPNSRKRATEVLADVPDDEVVKITETNARTMLRFPRSS
ncbi:amidohydrolase family protein [Pseudonocardia sp. KRD291]|uniref:amidohydrolase family protein n=1 Tax=Pseudonocardia sp. KRD291 TaxID=2792007 RepID=UPI001C4A030E|nr:amidohydrolase family protein [Pseudonocardia sp. KRD291]MBW0101248.1 amidohydrolase [Pseudonocardia sp. KRD291]